MRIRYPFAGRSWPQMQARGPVVATNHRSRFNRRFHLPHPPLGLRRPKLRPSRQRRQRQSPPPRHLLPPNRSLLLDPRHQPTAHPQPIPYRLHPLSRRRLRVPPSLHPQRPRVRPLRPRRQRRREPGWPGPLLMVPQAHAGAQAFPEAV